MKSFFRSVLFLTLVSLFLVPSIYAGGCPDCVRRAALGKCVNHARPADYDEREKKWFECLTLEMGYKIGENWFVSDDEEDRYEAAKEACKDLNPDCGREFSYEDNETMQQVIQAALTTNFTSERLRFVPSSMAAGTGQVVPDYIFEAEYDCVEVPNVDIVTKEEKYPATLNMRLYYNGESKELVKEWTAEHESHEMEYLITWLIKNKNAVMKQDAPLINLIDRFEKMPVSCSFDPEKDTCSYNTRMNIDIKDFRDAYGKKSREFCRVAVYVKDGRILNGTTPSGLQEGKVAVFRVGDGNIRVEYEAPDTSLDDRETIKVFHCHDIAKLPVVPLANTKISKKVIAEGVIPYSLPGVTAILEVNYMHSRNEDRTYGQRNVVKKNWTENKGASVMFVFDDQPRVSRDSDQKTSKMHVTRYRYYIKDAKLLSAGGGGNGSEDSFISGTHIVAETHTNIQYTDLEIESSADRMVLDVDQETGLIVSAQLPKVILHGQVSGKRTGTKYIGDKSYDIHSDMGQETELTVNQEFGDYDSKEYTKVLDGDGKTILRGGLESTKKEKYGETEQSSKWTVTITPKQ